MADPTIYLDHNATSPLRPEVAAAMGQALGELWGNPSSVHAPGRRARAAVEDARAAVAALLGGEPEEVVFTSGGTEGNHLAVRGLASGHVLASPLEHPSVHGALAAAGRAGARVEWLRVGPQGELDLAALEAALRPDTRLVSVALANHELGNLYPVAEISALAGPRGILVHTDAVQAVGRVPLDVRTLGVDALTVSAHKLGGPKGVGALWVRRGRLPDPLLSGGHQERERRAGTENVPGIVGFGVACQLVRRTSEQDARRIAELRDRLEQALLRLPGARRHGHPDRRVPGTCNLGFEGAPGQLVVIGLDLEGVAISSGAACTSGSLSPSPVLLALGLPAERAREAVRFSLGPGTTAQEVERAAALTAAVVARVRASA